MTTQANRELIRHFWQASEHGNIAEMVALWAPDAINHGGQTAQAQRRPPAGIKGLKRVFSSLLTAFPDRKYLIEDLIASEDKVVCCLTVSGTHQGTPEIPVEGGMLMTIPATGKAYTVQQIHIFRVENNKIAEHWAVRDDLGMMQQLGVVPIPG
ncbi:MAG: ester cyclase [Ktedonobacteraceae bacterium]|nr:ester cyclase [Ktedonobacteraceae bacterium]